MFYKEETLFGVFLTIHIMVCVGLIVSVLMQSAKGEGLAGAFGGGGGGLSGAVFGGRGAATFLSKATTTLAIAFMVTCILLTFSGGGTGVTSSRISKDAEKALQDAQVTPMELPVDQQQAPAGTGANPAPGGGGSEQPPTEGE